MNDEMRNRLWKEWEEYETVMGIVHNADKFSKFCDKVNTSNFGEALEAVKNRTWMNWSD